MAGHPPPWTWVIAFSLRFKQYLGNPALMLAPSPIAITPKHASWLNMVEIEIGVLRSQCLDRRIDDKETILAEVAAWQQRRNAEGAQIHWMFTTQKAREKLRKAYPVKES